MTRWTEVGATTLTALWFVLLVEPLYAAERRSITSERFPASEGKRVVIDVGDVDVRIRSADVAEIEVTTDLRISGIGAAKADQWIDAHAPSFADSADELRITLLPQASGSVFSVGRLTSRARLGIVAPMSVVPDVTTTGGGIEIRGDFPLAHPLRMRTSTGDVGFTGAAGSFEIRSSSGAATLDLVRSAARLFARTASGSITAAGGAREVIVDTSSGDVSLENLSGPAKVETATGKVYLSWDRLGFTDEVTVRSSSGRVHLLLPRGVHPQGTLVTTTGTIESDLPGTFSTQGSTFQLTGEGPVFDVETASTPIIAVSTSDWED